MTRKTATTDPEYLGAAVRPQPRDYAAEAAAGEWLVGQPQTYLPTGQVLVVTKNLRTGEGKVYLGGREFLPPWPADIAAMVDMTTGRNGPDDAVLGIRYGG